MILGKLGRLGFFGSLAFLGFFKPSSLAFLRRTAWASIEPVNPILLVCLISPTASETGYVFVRSTCFFSSSYRLERFRGGLGVRAFWVFEVFFNSGFSVATCFFPSSRSFLCSFSISASSSASPGLATTFTRSPPLPPGAFIFWGISFFSFFTKRRCSSLLRCFCSCSSLPSFFIRIFPIFGILSFRPPSRNLINL